MVSGGRLITLVGQSGSGKTTQMRELLGVEGFRQSPNITTRSSRLTDLPNEYHYLSPAEYSTLKRSGRLLWDIVTGNGAHYSKDICDVIEAFTDPDNAYVNSLVPGKAQELVHRYGSEIVRVVFLPSPGDDVLLERMIGRGDLASDATERLSNEKFEDWLSQAVAIEGLYVVRAHSIAERHQEILDYATR